VLTGVAYVLIQQFEGNFLSRRLTILFVMNYSFP